MDTQRPRNLRGLFCCGKCFLQKSALLRGLCVYPLYDGFLVRSDAFAVARRPRCARSLQICGTSNQDYPLLLAVYSICGMQGLTLHGTAMCARYLRRQTLRIGRVDRACKAITNTEPSSPPCGTSG